MAVASPATIATNGTTEGSRCNAVREKTAAALAPDVMPMMSGEASGLRSMVWKTQPPIPKAAPVSRPRATRGIRSSPTVKEAPGTVPPSPSWESTTRPTAEGP